MSEYIMNKETGKIELHFDKADYLALAEDQKKDIKSNYLFSRVKRAWVSRAKFPNLYRAEKVAKDLGLSNGGNVGEKLTFAEQMERKAERAEARAERFDYKSNRAEENGKTLQKPINDMHGDISFFTQPNINSSSGRAFTKRRNRMWEAWEKGFDEFKKSEYYAERAEVARQTAENTRPKDKAFCDRRIKDAEKTIRAQRKNIESYKQYIDRISNGEEIKRYSGEILTLETVNEWIEHAEEIIDDAISKSVYYHECIEELGGIQFSKENIKEGYIVDINRWGKCLVRGTGKVNITYIILEGGASGLGGKAAYAEIKSIISDKVEDKPIHPFKKGEKYTVKEWNGKEYAEKEYTITKITNDKVTLKSGNERAKSIKPRRIRTGNGEIEWTLSFKGAVYGYTAIHKKEEGETV